MEKKASRSCSLIINPKSPIHLPCKQSTTVGQEKRAILASEMVPEHTGLNNIEINLSTERQLQN